MLGQIMIRSAPPNCTQSCAAALAAAMTETNYDWEQPAHDHGHPQDRTTTPQNSSNSLRCRMFIYDHLPIFSRFEGFTYTQRSSSSAGFSPLWKIWKSTGSSFQVRGKWTWSLKPPASSRTGGSKIDRNSQYFARGDHRLWCGHGWAISQIFETFRNMSTARIPQMFTFFSEVS